MVKKSELIRADPNFKKFLANARCKRLANGLEKDPRKLSDRELTRMLLNTNGLRLAEAELENKPRRII